jgi:hypothetical protein
MNCSEFRSRLLKAEDPSQPEEETRRHLVECAACAAWRSRLLQIEANVARLPIPLSTGRAAAVHRILHPDGPDLFSAAPRKKPARTPPKPPRPRLEEMPFELEMDGAFEMPAYRPAPESVLDGPRTRRRRAIIGAAVAAAGLLIVASTWVITRRPSEQATIAEHARPPVDALVARLVDRDMKLASAQRPGEKVQVLADIASDIHNETANLVNDVQSKDLMRLAEFYQRVVHEGLVEQARVVPPGEREDVLGPISARLSQSWHDAETTARDFPACAGVMKVIADAARDGDKQLHVKAAGAPTPVATRAKPTAERVQQLQQNLELIERLVQSSLSLAGAADALKRAVVCGTLAKVFAHEVGLAASSRDGPRALELGGHFQEVLRRGVGENLTVARREIPVGSTRDEEMRQVGDELDAAAKPVEKALSRAAEDATPEMDEALKAVVDGRADLQRVRDTIFSRSATR